MGTIHYSAHEAAATSPAVGPGMAATVGRATDPSRGAPVPAGPGTREVFLDVVRAVAIVRVIAWHTFGLPVITYFVAAIPAMFFVTGSLLAKSLGRRAAPIVLFDRFRRLLVPLWAFGAVAWAAMAVAAVRTGGALPLHRAPAWVLPLVSPGGSAWEGGWLSSHLWYLRTVVWLFLAAPLLLRAVRARPRLTLAVPVVAVFAIDLLSRGGALPLGRRAAWGAGDLALYSVFLLLGFLHRDGALAAVTRRRWIGVAVAAGIAAAAWRLTQPVPLGVVNDSHPLHFFVGSAWLAAALAAQPLLTRLGTSRLLGPAVRAIGRRSLTIYLWHTAAIIVAVNVLEARGIDGGLTRPIGLVALTTVGIAVAVDLFGWIEDVAARRRPVRTRRPLDRLGRRGVSLAMVVALAGVILLAPHPPRRASDEASAATRSSRRPPIPSRPPPAPTFDAVDPGPAPEPLTPQAETALLARLDQLLPLWAGTTGVRGALVGVAGPTLRWTGAMGSRPDTGRPVSAQDTIDLASLTKLYTATLVHRLAEEGRIDLAAGLPYIRALPDFPYERGITVEQLLSHTSGLVNYRDTARYLADEESIDSPVAGVMASVASPPAAAPGERHLYASTNFLVLGLLLEDIAGRPLGDLFRDGFFAPLQLRDTIHREPAPAWPRGGTAGIETSLPDLLTTGEAILRDHVGLSADEYAAMTDVDPDSGFGPGTFGFCPCRARSDGTRSFFGVGYYGATTLLVYAPALDLVIAVDLVDPLGDNDGYPSVFTLFGMIEELFRSS